MHFGHGDGVGSGDVRVEGSCVVRTIDEGRRIVHLTSFDLPFDFTSGIAESCQEEAV